MDSSLSLSTQSIAQRRALRVAVVTETYPPEVNGVAMTIHRMVAGLRERGHRIQLVRLRQGRYDRAAKDHGFEEVLQSGVPIPGYASLRAGLPAAGALARRWRAERPDIVHVVTEGPLGWSALTAAARLDIPRSSDFHTNFHTYTEHYGIGWLRKPITAYLRAFHNKAGCTLVPTASLRDELARHGVQNLRVVARGVDTQLFNPVRRSALLRELWHAGPGTPVVLYVGRLAPEKNLSVVLDAFSAMRAVRPDARLVFVGDGPERPALEAAFSDCSFAGMRHGEDLAAHYASGDILLFPSTTETYGNVTVEGMASGLAVIAYDYAAASEHIIHGRNGLLADFDNTADFTSLAAGLVGSPARIAELGCAARATAGRIDWRDVNDEFEAALQDIAGAGSGELGGRRLAHAAHGA